MATIKRGMWATTVAALALLLFTPRADAGCLISGVCSAARNTSQPDMGTWKYTLAVTWDTATRYALSHFDILLSPQNAACGCQDLAASLQVPSPAGTSNGNPAGCTVTFDWVFGCNGDPSIHLTDLLLKLEPRQSDTCAPGTTGQGTFTFYSNYPPAAIDEPNLALVDKFGQLVCYGTLTGVFPGLPCDPTATEPSTWGTVKSLYQ